MGPHFLCIGAPRCGTTWMYRNLGRHPQIQQLPGKELQFISARNFPRATDAQVAWWTERWQRTRSKDPEQLEWGLRWLKGYAALEESFESYSALFDIPEGKLAGDMSPDFCRLDLSGVRDVRQGLGDIPVFLLARDPIERDWSYAQLVLQYNKTAVQLTDETYIKFIESRRCQVFSDYIRMIDKWSYNFTNFKVFYLDDIKDNPQGLIRDVCRFLNIDPNPPRYGVREMAPNPASREIGTFVRTPAIYEAQKRISEPLMAKLKARLGGHPAAWYDRHFGSTPMPHDSFEMSDTRQG